MSPRAPLNRDLVRKRPAGRRQLETTARRPSFFLRRRLHRHGRMWRPSDGLASLFGPRLLRRRDGVVLQRSRSLEAFPTPKPRPAAAPGRSCLRRLCETRDARSGSTRACCGRLHEAPALPEEQGRHAGQGAPPSRAALSSSRSRQEPSHRSMQSRSARGRHGRTSCLGNGLMPPGSNKP